MSGWLTEEWYEDFVRMREEREKKRSHSFGYCPYCGSQYREIKKYKHEDDGEAVFTCKCTDCGKRYEEHHTYAWSQGLEPDSEEQLFVCEHCDMTRSNGECGVVYINDTDTELWCEDCRQIDACYNSIKRRFELVDLFVTDHFVCRFCGQVFHDSDRSEKHPGYCKGCGVMYAGKTREEINDIVE